MNIMINAYTYNRNFQRLSPNTNQKQLGANVSFGSRFESIYNKAWDNFNSVFNQAWADFEQSFKSAENEYKIISDKVSADFLRDLENSENLNVIYSDLVNKRDEIIKQAATVRELKNTAAYERREATINSAKELREQIIEQAKRGVITSIEEIPLFVEKSRDIASIDRIKANQDIFNFKQLIYTTQSPREIIKKTYYSLANKYHPDKYLAQSDKDIAGNLFQEVNRIY